MERLGRRTFVRNFSYGASAVALGARGAQSTELTGKSGEGQKETLDRNAKAVPFPIERRLFEETNTTVFRLPKAA